jgi:hypothetical protein
MLKYLAVLLLLTAAAFGQSAIIPFPGVPKRRLCADETWTGSREWTPLRLQ